MDAKQTRLGIILALAAYFIWGIAPAYFKLIYYVPADEILTHRVIWSFFFMVALISVSRQWPQVKKLLKTPRKIFLLALSAVLVGGNWLLFIWAVNNHHMLEASLGYFINPLVNILLGMIFLGERFRRLQWLAVILAFCGVLVQLWTFGSLPIIGLGLAFSFAFYGLVRKKIAVDAQTGMLVETLWLLPVAAIWLFGITDSPTSHMGENPWSLNLLLMAAGVVTTIPLLCFTGAATRLRLSTLGFFQYIGPTLMFLLAVTFYGEVPGKDKMVTFGFIWVALAVFIVDALYTSAGCAEAKPASDNKQGSRRSLFLQPVFTLEVEIWRQAGQHHKDDRPRVAEAPVQLRHKFKVHPVAGRHQGWRQEHHRHHREDLDDAVLLDVDEAHRRLHQEVHLLEQ